MENYSYGHASEEWTSLGVDPNAAAAVVAMLTPRELQSVVNAQREASAADLLRSSDLEQKVSFSDISIPTRDGSSIPARVYKPKTASSPLPLYVFFHGGGYMFGSIASEHYQCMRTASLVPMVMVHVCYRHSPAFQHPTQTNDAWDGFTWAVDNAGQLGADERIVVGGISAGAGLAAAVILRENQGKRRVCGQVLAIPWLYHCDSWNGKTECSYAQNEHAPMLPLSQVQRFAEALGAGVTDEVFPGNTDDGNLAGMPKTVVLVAGMDVLRDEGLEYAKRLQGKGVDVKTKVFPGLPHMFYRYDQLPSVGEWYSTIGDGIKWMTGS